MSFQDYFSFKAILTILCSIRVREAYKRHTVYFYWSRLQLEQKYAPESVISSAVSKLLPPRRQWHRGTKEQRRGKQTKTILRDTIYRTVQGIFFSGHLEEYEWGRTLLAFVKSVQKRINEAPFTFNSPQIHLIRKTKGRFKIQTETQKKVAFRCLSVFEDLQDRVIIGCLSKYIRDNVDQDLDPHCYAFRKNGRMFSYKTAVADLINFRKRFSGKKLFVAECDIQKFFDTINHNAILAAYDSFAQRSDGNTLDPRARKMVIAYLESYSFSESLERSTDPFVLSHKRYVDRVPEKDLRKLYPSEDVKSLPLGLPQGGAASPIIANLMMDAVDRAVLSENDKDLFYARFCDDMVIVHPSKKKCQEALNRYLEAVTLLRLPIHPLKKRVLYSKTFYSGKSKGPYAWKQTEIGKSGSPWVSFLGHQIRYDGVVRVRQESIDNHEEKMRVEASKFKRFLKIAQGIFRKDKDIEDLTRDFNLRLLSSGTGQRDLTIPGGNEPCWLSAFQQNITHHRPAEMQLRELDAFKGKLLARLKGKYWPPKEEETESDSWNILFKDLFDDTDQQDTEPLPLYYGAPFSYYGTFKGLERPDQRITKEEEEDWADPFFYDLL